MNAQRALLPGSRRHFQHGPIDLVIGAEGEALAVEIAHEAASARFCSVLPELVTELPSLRRPVRGLCPLQGVVARRMWLACLPAGLPHRAHRAQFITPMAAVAGAVAQEIVACYRRIGIARAWVNNGGDIALHLVPGASVKVGLFAELAKFDPADVSTRLDADFSVTADPPERGIATSGWRGRSFSLGIADSETVLARSAAMADAAATVIANAVNVAAPRIVRRPANELKDDSDLGDTPVIVGVPPLAAEQVQQALHAKALCACALQRLGLIHSAVLVCQHRADRVEPGGRLAAPGTTASGRVGSVVA